MLRRRLQPTAIALLALLAGPPASRADDQPLPKAVGHPRAIVNLTGCILPYYRWVSRDEVLLFQGDVERLKLTGLSIAKLGKSGLTPRLIPIPGFQEMWAALRQGWPDDHDPPIVDAIVSPSGHSLLIQNFSTWIVKSLRDADWSPTRFDSFTPFKSPIGDPFWTADATHVIVTTEMGFEVYNMREGKAIPANRYPLPSEELPEPHWRRPDFHWGWSGMSGKLYYLSDPRANPDATSNKNRIWELRECKRYDDPELVRLRTVREPPQRGWVRDVALSPDEKQLAWLTVLDERTAEIWVTDLDGENARLLVTGIEPSRVLIPGAGTISADDPPDKPAPAAIEFDHRFTQFSWRPGTTEITYNSGGKLWVVDARQK